MPNCQNPALRSNFENTFAFERCWKRALLFGKGNLSFPNFNMSLKDPHLCDALKVQVQIIGASQVQDTFAATLHYQLAYRL